MTGAPEDVAWMVLRGHLAEDSAGREILLSLATDPARGADLLRGYMESVAGPRLSTVVTGGTVDKLVNIAQAGVVNIALQRRVVPPRQLPPRVLDFTDRVSAADEVRLAVAGGGARLFAVLGGGGIGKTALAVKLAYELAPDADDVQLYVDLAGGTPTPRSPHTVLEGLVRALGAEPETIPDDTGERAALHRALLSGRRGVVVLDNAASVGQLLPLLPGAGAVVVLVTSRDPLVGLPDAVRISLDVLAPRDAADLLTAAIGRSRVQAEPEAVATLARLCGHLPLALRIASARLASRPRSTVAGMVARMADEGRRLNELTAGELAVRSSFAVSYEGLDPAARRAFRRAALVPGQDFPAWVVAALTGTDADDADDVVEQLADLRLLEFAGDDAAGRARYRFHDLLRLFARERLAAEDDDAERSAAVRRLLDGYLGVARRGLYLLSPHSKRDPVAGVDVTWSVPAGMRDDLLADPYAWFAAEHAALVGAVRIAHDGALWPYAYELAEQLHYYLRVHGHLADWVDTHELALAATRRQGDRRAEAWTLRNLGNARLEQGRYADAAECFGTAAAIFIELGNTLGSAATLCNLGETRMTQGLFAAAADDLRRCLPDWQAVDDPVGVAYTVDNLGYIALCQGEFAAAAEHLRRSLRMFVELGDGFGEAHSLRRRAELAVEQDELVEAGRHLDRAEELFADAGSASGKGWVALTRVTLDLAGGRVADALGAASEAVTTFQVQENPRAAAQAMVRLGEVLVESDRRPEAVAVLEQAAHLLDELDDRFGAGLATLHLGRARGPATEPGAALLREAAERFAALPAPLWERRARAATVRS